MHCAWAIIANKVVVQLLSRVQLFATPWTAAHQTPLSPGVFAQTHVHWVDDAIQLSRPLLPPFSSCPQSFPASGSFPMKSALHSSVQSVTLSCLTLCNPMDRSMPGFPVLHQLQGSIRWPKYWSFNFSISPSNEYSGWFPLRLTGLISLLPKGFSRVFSSTSIQKH